MVDPNETFKDFQYRFDPDGDVLLSGVVETKKDLPKGAKEHEYYLVKDEAYFYMKLGNKWFKQGSYFTVSIDGLRYKNIETGEFIRAFQYMRGIFYPYWLQEAFNDKILYFDEDYERALHFKTEGENLVVPPHAYICLLEKTWEIFIIPEEDFKKNYIVSD